MTTRCFVLGNGPSLQYAPFEMLKNEVTFAVNRIDKIFPCTDWRPTCYVRSESHVDEDTEQREIIISIIKQAEKAFVPYTWKKWLKEPNVEFRHTCRHFKYNALERPSKECKAWHLPMWCDYGTCVTMAIQVAQDFDEIYLLGCDLGFSDTEQDHFYETEKKGWPAKVKEYNIIKAHETAKRESKAKIYNATPGSKLETYEKANFCY